MDEVRREIWNAERGGKGRSTPGSKSLKKARWALLSGRPMAADAMFSWQGASRMGL